MLMNLKVEMCRKKISAAQISRHLRIDVKTMSKKVNEKTQFTRTEMYKIYEDFFPDTDFYDLFRSE